MSQAGFDPPRQKWPTFNWMQSGCSTSKPPRLDCILRIIKKNCKHLNKLKLRIQGKNPALIFIFLMLQLIHMVLKHTPLYMVCAILPSSPIISPQEILYLSQLLECISKNLALASQFVSHLFEIIFLCCSAFTALEKIYKKHLKT